jgi:hypothetical protein
MRPKAMLEISPEDAMSWVFIRFSSEGPIKIPTMIKAVTVGSFIFWINLSANSPRRRMNPRLRIVFTQ